ncbi:HalOD1 output domain-containing protein [Halosimplex amylolyticum]|uniref:HalOD1 output domain-containing protein n=1 Tax=Halosimplex amylolyticum TaxID=3396616 RepID=UPI003F5506E4
MSSGTNGLGDGDRVGYDPTTETYRSLHDWNGSESLCLTVVEAVSAVSGLETNEMKPLYSVLDPEALEALLSPVRDGDVRVSFPFGGCTVTVANSGEVGIDPDR